MDKKISVIIPAYNVELYIKRCVDSVLRQNLENIEILIIDDASTDLTNDIVKSIYGMEKRVRLVRHEQNAGLGCARNTGITYAMGQYLFFLDSDDWIEDDTLSKLYNIAKTQQVDIVACGIRAVYEDGEFETYHAIDLKTTGHLQGLEALLKGRINMVACNKLYRKDFINRYKLSFPPIYHEDMVFAMEAIYYCNSFVSISEELYNYFHRSQSINRGTLSPKHIDSYIENFKLIDAFSEKNNLRLQQGIMEKLFHYQVNWTMNKLNLFYSQTADFFERDKVLHEVLTAHLGRHSYLIKALIDDCVLTNQKNLTILKFLKIQLKEKKIIFFGTGSASEKILEQFPFKIEYFVDNNSLKWNTKLDDINICNPMELLKENKENTAIIVASQYYNEISKQLQSMGYEENVNFWNGCDVFKIYIAS